MPQKRMIRVDLLSMARELCELEDDELNQWEASFVDSVTRQLEGGDRQLSPKQVAVLRKLHEREF